MAQAAYSFMEMPLVLYIKTSKQSKFGMNYNKFQIGSSLETRNLKPARGGLYARTPRAIEYRFIKAASKFPPIYPVLILC